MQLPTTQCSAPGESTEPGAGANHADEFGLGPRTELFVVDAKEALRRRDRLGSA